jgi:hypothetical protein
MRGFADRAGLRVCRHQGCNEGELLTPSYAAPTPRCTGALGVGGGDGSQVSGKHA